MQDTPLNPAADGATLCGDHPAPPLTVVRMTPCPERVLVRVAALVPTATHQAPGTPAGAVVVVVLLGGGTVDAGTVVTVVAVVADPEVPPDGAVVTGVVTGVVVDVKGRPP